MKRLKQFVAFLVSCTLLPAVGLAVVLDEWAGASHNLVFQACLVAFGMLIGFLVLQLGRHKAFLLVPSAYILFMLALPFVDLSPVKPAIRAIHEIQPGMTQPQVRAVIDRHFPEKGRFKRPKITILDADNLSFVLDPTDGRYDAAIMVIKFSEGKCVSARFLPD